MKKLFFAGFLLFFLTGAGFALAQDKIDPIKVNFFYSPTCPHCQKEEKFLDGMQKKYPDIIINRFSITERENIDSLKKFYLDYKVPQKYYGTVPATFINTDYFIGYNDAIGQKIEKCILDSKSSQCENAEGDTTFVGLEGEVSFPFLGKIDIKKYSLPVLTVLLGLLDGFNVCSLGALVLILGMVLAFRSRKKVLLFGGLFIITTAVVYGILIAAWYNIFSLFSPYINIMNILIGGLGIGGGAYFLREFLKFRKYGPTCEVSSGKGLVAKFSSRFNQSIQDSGSTILLLGSVLLFAGIITIVEFPCSAVIPVAYAGLLVQADLPSFAYLLYISTYLFFYMLDEIIVFLIAFFTMKVWLASNKVTIWITLIESITLFILGLYYLYANFAVYFN